MCKVGAAIERALDDTHSKRVTPNSKIDVLMCTLDNAHVHSHDDDEYCYPDTLSVNLK